MTFRLLGYTGVTGFDWPACPPQLGVGRLPRQAGTQAQGICILHHFKARNDDRLIVLGSMVMPHSRHVDDKSHE